MNQTVPALRKDAVLLFQAGIQAAHPADAIKQQIEDRPDRLIIGIPPETVHYPQPLFHIIAVGKAAPAMAEACLKAIAAEKIKSALAVTTHNNLCPVDRFQVIAAGHPFPDEASLKAGQIVHKRLTQLQSNESVLLLWSGGASALLASPAKGIALQDKVLTTRLLMDSGANIAQLNCVRKHLSALKGGQMAKLIAPHRSHSLILSDVPDNDLSVIASGPTYPDESTFADAISILHQQNIWDKVPDSVQRHLIKGLRQQIPETPYQHDTCFRFVKHTLIGDNQSCLEAITKLAERKAYHVVRYRYPLTGNCRNAAEELVKWAIKNQKIIGSGKVAIITGGETTVTVKGYGLGGRNQEMALSFALAAKRHHLSGQWIFLSGGTDGIDGPTDAAGGLVDPESLNRIENAGEKLNNNDAYHALKQSQDLLIIGATDTNVADIQILLYQPN